MLLEMLSLARSKDLTSTKLYTGDGSLYQSVDMNVDTSSGKGFAIVGTRASSLYVPYTSTVGYGYSPIGNTLKGASNFASTGFQTTDGFTTGTFNKAGDDYVAVALSYGQNNIGSSDWGFSSVADPSFVPGSTQTVSHNLGSVPEAMWIWSSLDDGSGTKLWHWRWHSGSGFVYYDGDPSDPPVTNTDQPFNLTSTTFDVRGQLTQDGGSGYSTYYALLFGNGSYVRCGNFPNTGGGTVSVGWQPKVVIFYRQALGVNVMYNYIDVRDALGDNSSDLSTVWSPNTNDTFRTDDKITLSSTGFTLANLPYPLDQVDYHYIAIR